MEPRHRANPKHITDNFYAWLCTRVFFEVLVHTALHTTGFCNSLSEICIWLSHRPSHQAVRKRLRIIYGPVWWFRQQLLMICTKKIHISCKSIVCISLFSKYPAWSVVTSANLQWNDSSSSSCFMRLTKICVIHRHRNQKVLAFRTLRMSMYLF